MPEKSIASSLFIFPISEVLLTMEIAFFFFFYEFAEIKSKISAICSMNILLNGDVLSAVEKKIAM